MTPELTKKIEQEAHDYVQTLHPSDYYGNVVPAYIAGTTAWAERVEVLEKWKAEATILLDPLIKYGQAHPDIKIGACCTEFILNRAKAYDALFQRAEKLREALCFIVNACTNIDHAEEVAEKALENYKKETE